MANTALFCSTEHIFFEGLSAPQSEPPDVYAAKSN